MILETIKQEKITAGIHTCCIRATQKLENVKTIIGASRAHEYKDWDGSTYTTIVFNPNTYKGSLISSPTEFDDIVYHAMVSAGVPDYKITRIDMNFDNLRPNSYEEYLKLHRWFMTLISVHGNMNNRFESDDFYLLKHLNIRCQSDRLGRQAEVYHKKIEQERKGKQTDIDCRVEFRSYELARRKEPPNYETLIDEWFKLAEDAMKPDNVNAVCHNIDTIIAGTFETDIYKYVTKHGNKDCINAKNNLINEYGKYVYTREQLIDIYGLLGDSDPIKHATNYKQNRHSFELLTISHLQEYLKLLKRAARAFMSERKADLMIA